MGDIVSMFQSGQEAWKRSVRFQGYSLICHPSFAAAHSEWHGHFQWNNKKESV